MFETSMARPRPKSGQVPPPPRLHSRVNGAQMPLQFCKSTRSAPSFRFSVTSERFDKGVLKDTRLYCKLNPIFAGEGASLPPYTSFFKMSLRR